MYNYRSQVVAEMQASYAASASCFFLSIGFSGVSIGFVSFLRFYLNQMEVSPPIYRFCLSSRHVVCRRPTRPRRSPRCERSRASMRGPGSSTGRQPPRRQSFTAEFKLQVVREALQRPQDNRIKPTCRMHPAITPVSGGAPANVR